MYAFQYQRPATRGEAVSAAGGEARFLAGGQSLIQSMKLRLSSSDKLIDLGGIVDLKGITSEGGGLTFGAMTTHAQIADSAEVKRSAPWLAELAASIGDPMVRNMGTIGGSIANADPAADWPAAVLGLGATVKTSKRAITGDQFFTGLFETALDPGELIVSVTFPPAQRAAYVKYRQPASRFALVGVFVSQGTGGVRVAVTGAKSNVFRASEIEQALAKSFTAEAAKGIKVSTDGINADLHGSAAYRAAMVSVMASRAVGKALAR